MSWIGPAILGALLVGFGVLILVKPAILFYLIAGMFIMAGLALIGMAFSLGARKSNVSYRRIDEAGPFSEDS